MAFKIPTQAYTGSIRPITLEKDGKTVTVGGETCFPFYLFEGEMPHFPKIAIEVQTLVLRTGQKLAWNHIKM